MAHPRPETATHAHGLIHEVGERTRAPAGCQGGRRPTRVLGLWLTRPGHVASLLDGRLQVCGSRCGSRGHRRSHTRRDRWRDRMGSHWTRHWRDSRIAPPPAVQHGERAEPPRAGIERSATPLPHRRPLMRPSVDSPGSGLRVAPRLRDQVTRRVDPRCSVTAVAPLVAAARYAGRQRLTKRSSRAVEGQAL